MTPKELAEEVKQRRMKVQEARDEADRYYHTLYLEELLTDNLDTIIAALESYDRLQTLRDAVADMTNSESGIASRLTPTTERVS